MWQGLAGTSSLLAGCGTYAHDNSGMPTTPKRKKGQRQNQMVDTPTLPGYPPATQNGYLPIMCLDDKRLKQARCTCISDRFQVFRTEFYSEGTCKCLLRVW